VIVVGAGMGGISAAGKLQAEGHSVTLLEGRDRLGDSAEPMVMFGYSHIKIITGWCFGNVWNMFFSI
jgi:phytoene dehydrogenase-like protein